MGLRQRGTLQVSAWEVSGSRSDMIRYDGGQDRRARGKPEAQGSVGGKRAGRNRPVERPSKRLSQIQREAGIHSVEKRLSVGLLASYY